MASRLSDGEAPEAREDGPSSHLAHPLHQGLHVESTTATPTLDFADVDLDALVAVEDARTAVQAVPPQAMFRALLAKGPEDAIEVLELLSPEQLVRIVDYDGWRGDRLDTIRAIRWLNLYREVGGPALCERFRELDEEYQIALIAPHVALFDEEEYEKLPEEEQDRCRALPCGTLHYKVLTDDPRIDDFLTALVDVALSTDVNYCYALLAHAAYGVPNEAESMLSQFRRARLEEDGFVTLETSMAAFRPIDVAALASRYGQAPSAALATTQSDPKEVWLSTVLASGEFTPEEREQLTLGFVHLANAVATATQVEPDDAIALRALLIDTQALASLGLELVSGRDLATAVRVLRAEHPQTLFGAGLSAVRKTAERASAALVQYDVPGAARIARALRDERRGVALNALDADALPALGFAHTELLKGLMHRFPASPRDSHETTDGVRRTRFAPVGAITQLQALEDRVDAFLALLALARHATAADMVLWPLEARLGHVVARALATGELSAKPLTVAEMERLAGMPQEAFAAATGDLFGAVERLGKDDDKMFAASRSAGRSSAAALALVQAELGDLALGVAAAAEAWRRGDRAAAGAYLDAPASSGGRA